MGRDEPATDTSHTFEQLLEPILGAAYGTALHMTRHKDDAEDLVQEAAVRAFRSFHTFELGTNFKAWFFRILSNLYLNKYRQKQREPEIVNLAHLLVGSEGTLAFTKDLTLKLVPLPRNRVLGVVNFTSFHTAMDSAQHIVAVY